MEQRPKKLLDQVRETIRLKHYARRTEEAYLENGYDIRTVQELLGHKACPEPPERSLP